jgi:hypothetical protein
MDIRSRWYRAGAFLVLTLATLGGVALFQSRRPEPAPILLSTPAPVASPVPTATPRPLRVYVSGAVQAPDVYALAPESIVKDAILAAQGATDQADLDRINLAAPWPTVSTSTCPTAVKRICRLRRQPADSRPAPRSTSTQPPSRNSSNCRASGRLWPNASSTFALPMAPLLKSRTLWPFPASGPPPLTRSRNKSRPTRSDL